VTSVTYYAASTAVGAANYRLGVYDFMAVDTTLPDPLYKEGFIQLPLMASALVIYHSLNISSTLVRSDVGLLCCGEGNCGERLGWCN
jgi:hypothetical protein